MRCVGVKLGPTLNSMFHVGGDSGERTHEGRLDISTRV
jgi:hypothetical protein